jgi:hypothetical protein
MSTSSVQIRTGRIMRTPDFATCQDGATNCIRIAGLLSRRARRWIAQSLSSPAARLEALAEPGGMCVAGTVQNRDEAGCGLRRPWRAAGEKNCPIRAYRIRGGPSPTAAPVIGSSVPVPDKPSIAVLPFANMSSDPEQEYFAARNGRGDHRQSHPSAKAPQKSEFPKGLLRVGCAVMVRLVPAIVLSKSCQV